MSSFIERINSMKGENYSNNIFGGNDNIYIKSKNSPGIKKVLDEILKNYPTGGCDSCGGGVSKNTSGGQEEAQEKEEEEEEEEEKEESIVVDSTEAQEEEKKGGSIVVESTEAQEAQEKKGGRIDNVKVSFSDVSKIIEEYLKNI